MRSLFLGALGAMSLSGAALLGVACGNTTTIAEGPPVEPPAEAGPTEDAAPDVVDSGPPVDNGAPSKTYPAPHPPLPLLTNAAHGKVLAAPKVYLVFYPGYEHAAMVTAMAQTLGATSHWSTSTSEYGVGALGYAGMIELTGETPPTTIADTAVESFMSDKISSGAFGTPDASTIYTIFYPKTTTVTMKGGPFGASQSCSSFGGYHSDVGISIAGAPKKNFPYAVLPTCAMFGGLDEPNGLTGALSHEWAEASTDPFPSTNQGKDSAFSSVDSDHFIWVVLGGGAENGDLCVPEPNAFYKPANFPYTVQRTWSNKLAAGSHDPCAPSVPGPAYFNSAPVLDEDVTLDLSNFGGGQADTKGVKIPVGKTKTIEVDLFSDAATSGPWTVGAVDTISQFTKQAPTLDFKWDRTTGLNGEKLHLTVTVKSDAQLVTGAHPFIITSKLGGQTWTWPGLIVDQ